MAYLKLESVSKDFGQTSVLKSITTTIEQGKFIAILGPSGCGKSTLLNIIAGIESPTTGELFLQNNNITMTLPEKRHVGMVFQDYTLFPNLTVEKNIAYGLTHRLKNNHDIKQRVNRLLDLVGLPGTNHQYPDKLSGGQQQRVALARALAPEPALLLLDEPLSALDAQVRGTLGAELLRIQQHTGITTLMVTHDQQEALLLADWIILLNDGRIEQEGTPNMLYNKPCSRFVAEFIGNMNVIELKEINQGRVTGIRYEDVIIAPATETTLALPYTWVGKIQHSSPLGAYCRLKIQLNDFMTYLYADVARSLFENSLTDQHLIAVSLPQQYWCNWD